MDHHRLAADRHGVVDPGLDLGLVLPGGAASQVERIGDVIRPDDAAMGVEKG